MTIRSLLLAGTVLPLTIGGPALALDRTSDAGLQLAQVECPQGEACPPTEEQQPGMEQPAMDQPAPEQGMPQMQEQPDEQGMPQMLQQPDEQPSQPDQQPPQPQPDLQPPEQPDLQPEQLPQQEQGQPSQQEQPAQLDQPVEQQLEPPQPEMQTETVPADQPTVEPSPVEQSPPPPEQQQEQPDSSVQPADGDQVVGQPIQPESTVEQQLEAQGDEQEASQVRSLREQLQEQLQDAGVIPQGEPAGDNRNRDRRRDRGWWSGDEDRNVVERRDERVIIDLGGGNIAVDRVAPDEGGRLLYGADNVEVVPLEDGRTRTIVYRRNGVQIITNRDRDGNIIRRVKRLPDGRDIVLIDNTVGGSYDADRTPILRDVPPPIIGIPEDQYVVDLGVADYEQLRDALLAPLVQRIPRHYTLDEVLRNEPVRAYSPRIDLDTITFDFGSATIGIDQMRSLFELGRALEDVIAENPDEVYLIEGHTDLVGSNYDNLILSDRRAETVAVALSQNFDIPPENLITQGYGEEYPKIATEGPERRNRRATVRRVTELLQAQN